jgi:hypothetical protein
MDEEKIRRCVKYQEDAKRLDEDHELRDGPLWGPPHKPPPLVLAVDFI